jgi:hypothetical protein
MKDHGIFILCGVRNSAVLRTLPFGPYDSGQKASMLRTFAQIAFGNFFYPQNISRNGFILHVGGYKIVNYIG